MAEMQRISLPWIIEVFIAINALSNLRVGQKLSDVSYALFNAQQQLENLYLNSIYGPYLKTSRAHADKMQSFIGHTILRAGADLEEERVLNELELFTLNHNKDQFRIAFLAELGSVPAYLVGQKASYDTDILIDNGFRLFPQSLSLKCPEAISDANEAGRALAYELGTACGFHAFRVTESVVRRYWDHASLNSKRPHPQTLGNIANEMESRKIGDERIIGSIRQMTKLHRNPLIHPEVMLSVDEAIGIIGMSCSVISAIVKVLPDAPITNSLPPAVE